VLGALAKYALAGRQVVPTAERAGPGTFAIRDDGAALYQVQPYMDIQSAAVISPRRRSTPRRAPVR
jgi:hypothetical protein